MTQLQHPHSLPLDEVFSNLRSSSQGLDHQEVKKRHLQFGKNRIQENKTSLFKILFRQFSSTLILVLFLASLVSLFIGEFLDFGFIICVIIVNGLLGFWQELKAESSLAALKELTESKHKVMRNGQMQLVDSSDLVPGDYLILHEGEVVTADIRLTESSGLMIDESSLTGESQPVVKDHTVVLPQETLPYELKNMLLTGTTLVRGTGHGVVTQTGSHTYLAKIAKHTEENSPETPLTKAVRVFTKRYLILIALFFSSLGVIGHLQNRNHLDLAYILLASIVSAVPEGLPVVVTLVMVIGAIALSKKQALIRYLPSVETLGSATIIASDKTGTITEGKLIVREVYAESLEELRLIAALCNDAHEGSGDPMDIALADWVKNFEELREKHPRKWAYSFDSKLMLMATINCVQDKTELFVKGAYEALKERASQESLSKIEGKVNDFLEQGLRVLAFAKSTNVHEDPSEWKLHIVGLIGFFDPPKRGVKDAVLRAKSAGIRTLMITGDHPQTALAVAKEIGIHADPRSLLTGQEIEIYSEEELTQALKTSSVLARVLPEHKYRIVKALQKDGEIVAVTGDGINDIAALKVADIGIAMGSGTQAAKQVANMVITDNNLKVIVGAIRNARIISDNIRKVIYYLISTSMQELAFIALTILFSLPLPLSAIQILWINLVTGGVQDKNFAFTKEEGDVMARRPQRSHNQFFDLSQLLRMLSYGVPMGILCFLLYIHLLPLYSFQTTSTIIFTSAVVSQLANGVQAQKEKEPFFQNILTSFTINPFIYLGLFLGISLQIIAVYAMPHLLHSVPLAKEVWIYPALMFFASFFIVEARKWLERLCSFCRFTHSFDSD